MELEDDSNNKRKRGQRGSNKMSSSVVYVTKLDFNGLPSEPPKERKAFKHTSGFQVRDNVPIAITYLWPVGKAFKRASEFQVRDNVPITITDWWPVPATIKEKIWNNIKEKIKFPAGAEDVVKTVMLINTGSFFVSGSLK
jgi:hypothetical protein